MVELAKNLDIFLGFVLAMTTDSSSLPDVLLCMGLIRVAWEKLNGFKL